MPLIFLRQMGMNMHIGLIPATPHKNRCGLEHERHTPRLWRTPWPAVALGRDPYAVLMDFISSPPAATESAYCPCDRSTQTGAKTSLRSQLTTHRKGGGVIRKPTPHAARD